MNLSLLHEKFSSVFNHPAETNFFAPGRINLIGEHIDYNGGLVFPAPITLGTYASVSKREDRIFKVYSMNFESLGILEFSLDDLTYRKEANWTNYLKGVIKFIIEQGHSIPHGLNMVIFGNIPNGSGLSSSASLEMLIAKVLIDMFNLSISPVEAALLGKKVENEYIGVNSGIMDQFAISLGQKDTAILLDCNTLDYDYVPIKLPNHSIVIMNTNKRRELADSKYNERRSECEAALLKLQSVCNIHALCELSPEEFEKHGNVIENEVQYARSKHAVYENERVKNATHALKNNDLETFGTLLNASHTSLRDLYAVTGKELDTLVEAAWAQEGVVGARMTGAGFGGCSIAIVENSNVDAFIKNVGIIYENVIGYPASFYIASIGDGPIQINTL